MGFRKPDLDQAQIIIQKSMIEICSPQNDGFTAAYCKRDLYMLKCWLEDQYDKLPNFGMEKEWEQERIVAILKRQ